MSCYDFSKVNFTNQDVQQRLARAFARILEASEGASFESEKKASLDEFAEPDKETTSKALLRETSTVFCPPVKKVRHAEEIVQLELGI